jgi:transcriptional regulator with XRE-family HTH domain
MNTKSTTLIPSAVMPYNTLIGKILQRHREHIGKNQSEVAEVAGLTQSAYSRIESGQSPLTLPHLHAISYALGIKPDEVLKEADQIAGKLVSQNVSVPFDKPENSDDTKAALLIGLGILLLILAATSK